MFNALLSLLVLIHSSCSEFQWIRNLSWEQWMLGRNIQWPWWDIMHTRTHSRVCRVVPSDVLLSHPGVYFFLTPHFPPDILLIPFHPNEWIYSSIRSPWTDGLFFHPCSHLVSVYATLLSYFVFLPMFVNTSFLTLPSSPSLFASSSCPNLFIPSLTHLPFLFSPPSSSVRYKIRQVALTQRKLL